MQHFAAQLQPGQQTTLSLRASQYKPTNKRKRVGDDEDAEEPLVNSPAHGAGHRLRSANARSQASLDLSKAAQLRVAGLLPEDEFDIPPPPFPHAPSRTSKATFSHTKLQKELRRLDPPLYAVNGASKSQPIDRRSERPALRQTHLDVLSTLMHNCLLEGDYPRAGRAWGLILRSQIAGLPIDPRNHDRWGMGAELLLRNAKDHFARCPSSPYATEDDNAKSPISNEKTLYTQQGFELAREYYERLIVQHPNRKHLQHSVDDRTFYPAMFSLWIYEVRERIKHALQVHEEDAQVSTFRSTSFDKTTIAPEDAQVGLSVIRDEELREARDIAQRMDQLVVSPPFDKHGDMLQLRGMVGLWIGDLIMREDQPEQEDDEWGMKEAWGSIALASARKRHCSDSIKELEQSLSFFERAQINGCRLGKVVSSVQSKIRDLTKRITKLEG